MAGLENLVGGINFGPEQQEQVNELLSDINTSAEALGEFSDELSEGTNLLTETEVELIDALSTGHKVGEAAKLAGIDSKDVRAHITQITSKLGVGTIEEATLKAFQHQKLPRWAGVPRHNLSVRQEEAVRLAAQGKSYVEMAQEMGLTVNTVNVNMSTIGSKLRVSGRLAIVRAGLERGIHYGASEIDRRNAHVGALATRAYRLLNNDEQHRYVERKVHHYQYPPVPRVEKAAVVSPAAEEIEESIPKATLILETPKVSALPDPNTDVPKSSNGAQKRSYEKSAIVKPDRVTSICLTRLPKERNEALESISHGISAGQESISTQAALRSEFGARTNAHLIRKVINEKYGRLPFKNIFEYVLETKEELQVLQYLSFGATTEDVAFLLDTKGKKKTAAQAKAIIDQIVTALEAVNEDHAVYLGFDKGYLGSEDPSFIIQKETEILKASEKRPISDEDE